MHNPDKRLLAEAQALDERRQGQIQNQVDSINRLLDDGSYDQEMAALHLVAAGWRARYNALVSAVQPDHMTITRIEERYPVDGQ